MATAVDGPDYRRRAQERGVNFIDKAFAFGSKKLNRVEYLCFVGYCTVQ
jgi:hypothetical protein